MKHDSHAGHQLFLVCLIVLCSGVLGGSFAQNPKKDAARSPELTLSRPVRPWEFVDAVGTQAGIFGHENGTLEVWAYPLKILRDFRLAFRSDQHVYSGESLARTVTVRPESTTILYASDGFSVRETLFVPLNEAGAIVELEVNAFSPVEIEVSFERDFQLMWPAAIGGTFIRWDNIRHGFAMGADGHPYYALAGSPQAMNVRTEYFTNYTESRRNSFSLPQVEKQTKTYLVVIAASLKDQQDAEQRYARLLAGYQGLQQQAADYYREYLARTVSVSLPDAQIEAAYNWARVSLLQGLVENPYMGKGLVAGYRTSWASRPGFAWFFGRDALWSSLALISEGDFATVRASLDILSRYQRDDGKIAHEIPQPATLVPWFKNYRYAYDDADSTPLYIIAVSEYVRASGDVAFGREKWDALQRAYGFMRSTYSAHGWPRNAGVGTGWMENGPLFPMGTEIYLAGLAVEAGRALASLARINGQIDLAGKLESTFVDETTGLNRAFWSPERKMFAVGLNQQGHRVEVPSVLTAVPMWWGLLEEGKAQLMIDELAAPTHSTDWGMRNGSNRQPDFDPAGYQYGTVWPLFTGWASVSQYRYHRPLPAYANLRANAMLTLDGSLGRTVETLSGTWYQPLLESCPHQMWSSAMVIAPVLRGMMGLFVDSTTRHVRFAPAIPATWNHVGVSGVRVGDTTLQFSYSRTDSTIDLTVGRLGGAETTLEFAPSLSPHATVRAAEVDGKPAQFTLEQSATEQRPLVRVALKAQNTRVHLEVRGDFALEAPAALPALGEQSSNLKLVSEAWDVSRSQYRLRLAGLAGHDYELRYRGTPLAVEGGELDAKAHTIHVRIPASGAGGYRNHELAVKF